MSVSVVYVLGQGSLWKDYEIRLSLRSIEKHLTNVKDVWIIGWMPPFLTDLNHIPADDPSYLPDTNIMRKILKACAEPNISDTFLFMNDDHYLLAPFDATTFPNYYNVTLNDYLATRKATLKMDPSSDRYAQATLNTKKWLEKDGHPIKNFDVHYPILYNKQKFVEIFSKLPAKELEAPNHGYILKSLYANTLHIEGVGLQRDCKFESAPPPKYKCVSTNPKVKYGMQRFLFEQFPDPSKWELPEGKP